MHDFRQHSIEKSEIIKQTEKYQLSCWKSTSIHTFDFCKYFVQSLKRQVRALFPPLTEVFLFSTFNSKSRDKHVLTDMRRAFTDIPIKLSISDLHQRISCQGARLTGDWFEQLFESFLVTVELVVSSDELLPKLLRLNLTTPAQLFTIGDF